MNPSLPKLALASLALCVLPQLHAQTTEEKAILAPIQATFDGMSAHNADMIKSGAIPGAKMVYLHDGKPGETTIEAFAERLGKPPATTPAPAIKESIHDPVIHIDNDLAVVWAPFDFTIEGKVDHCGTDLFNLMKIDGQWRITSITWNSRKDCPAH